MTRRSVPAALVVVIWVGCACTTSHERDASLDGAALAIDAPDSGIVCDRAEPRFDRGCDAELDALCAARDRGLAGPGWLTFGRCVAPFPGGSFSRCGAGTYCFENEAGGISCQCAAGLSCSPDEVCVAPPAGSPAQCVEMCAWLRDF